jgi:hypothetical protein
MMNKLKKTIFVSLALIGFLLVSGHFAEAQAQCSGDPFCKPNVAKQPNPNAPKTNATTTGTGTGTPTNTKGGKPEKPLPPAIVPVAIPDIQARINYYKQLRDQAAANGFPIPKPTVVMTLDEMSITGIFRTPRGMAAMVQATPINLSYTIYPGDKFFNGQLVAIEDNRLVFRKVVKMSNGKFIASEENKPLRQYTQQEELQGTAPTNASAPAETKPQTAATQPAATEGGAGQPAQPVQPVSVVPLVDEMNRQPAETPTSAKDKTDKSKKGKTSTAKKPAKVAAKKKQ